MWKALIQVCDSTNWNRSPPFLNLKATTAATTSVATVTSRAICFASSAFAFGTRSSPTDPASGIAPRTVNQGKPLFISQPPLELREQDRRDQGRRSPEH